MIDEVRARTFPDTIVTARCIDCDLEFTGPIGVRIIPQGPALEIVVVCEKRNEVHAIARVPVGLIPVEHVHLVPLSPAGSA